MPDSLHERDARLWSEQRSELLAFLAGARRRYAPSLQQRIDLQGLYEAAKRQGAAALAARPNWPAACPTRSKRCLPPAPMQ